MIFEIYKDVFNLKYYSKIQNIIYYVSYSY